MIVNNTKTLPSELILLKKSRLAALKSNSPDIFHALDHTEIDLLGNFFALSDFGFEQLVRNDTWLLDIINHSLLTQTSLASAISARFNQLIRNVNTEKELDSILRQCRNFFQTVIAWRDLCALIDIEQSLHDVSYLADTLIIGARDGISTLLRPTWGTPVDDQGNEQPLMILGMGKLGGKELNFSSDIDLIFSFPRHGSTQGGRRSTDNQQYFVKLAQKLINALDKVTVDGFVYRVDMRLRPFGNSGPLVVSYAALEDYYQSQGRDWERYAMVKARVLGDAQPYNTELMDLIRPFMFRRYIDFSVIESLRKMKLMIKHEVRRRSLVDNIKLGSGGIREIEFIIQSFQMVRGGREPRLQHQSLLITLAQLASLKIITVADGDLLLSSYRFLRQCEQTLQQIGDQQTQTLPSNALDWQRLLVVTNQANEAQFRRLLAQYCQVVEQQFSQVIGEEESVEETETPEQKMLIVLMASDENADAINLLDEMGCLHSQTLLNEIYQLREDLSKRRIGVRGREAMDKLIPLILAKLLKKNNCDVLYQKIGKILTTIATRTAYIELLLENPGALKQLITLCDASDWISEQLTQHPILLDELLDPKALYSPTPLDQYSAQLRQYLMRIPEDDLEQVMEGLRQYKQGQQLRISAADVTGVMEVMIVSDHLTALAQTIIAHVIDIAWQSLVTRYGEPEYEGEQKGFAVIGYGKLGGMELGYGSDLDLVFVHSALANTVTKGSKSIDSGHFYLKLAQRVLHLFNTRTVSGILYELDMRLRPSGSKGLMVTHIDSFIEYQNTQAWVWEHQALVRTRIVCGSLWLTKKFDDNRQKILSRSRSLVELRQNVVNMRSKMRAHLSQGTQDTFDIKQDTGGIADIEFIAQFLVLGYADRHPELIACSDNISIFEQAATKQLITRQQQNSLTLAYQAYRHKGHRLVLNDLKNYAPDTEFEQQRTAVIATWHALLLA